MKLLIDELGVIHFIAEEMAIVNNGIFVPLINTIFTQENFNIVDVEVVPVEVMNEPITRKFKYVSGIFSANENYCEPIDPINDVIDLKNRCADLEVENLLLKQKLRILPPISNPSTLQDYQTNKIYELSKACETEILAGFYSTARGIREWFTNSRDDQNNIVGQATLATLNPAIIPQWKSANESICTDFSMAQIIQLATDGALFKTERIKTFEMLKVAVMSANTVEEVEAIAWADKVW